MLGISESVRARKFGKDGLSQGMPFVWRSRELLLAGFSGSILCQSVLTNVVNSRSRNHPILLRCLDFSDTSSRSHLALTGDNDTCTIADSLH